MKIGESLVSKMILVGFRHGVTNETAKAADDALRMSGQWGQLLTLDKHIASSSDLTKKPRAIQPWHGV
jgi:hypothetical protein